MFALNLAVFTSKTSCLFSFAIFGKHSSVRISPWAAACSSADLLIFDILVVLTDCFCLDFLVL